MKYLKTFERYSKPQFKLFYKIYSLSNDLQMLLDDMTQLDGKIGKNKYDIKEHKSDVDFIIFTIEPETYKVNKEFIDSLYFMGGTNFSLCKSISKKQLNLKLLSNKYNI